MTAELDREFDVVIPAHNAAATVAQAVRSALEQHRPPLTVTVVVDTCTDDTPRLAAAAGAHVVVSASGTPGGARNAGARVGRAGWIAFLDADDLWRPDWLGAVAATVAGEPGVDVCFGTVEVVDADGAPIGGPEPRRPSGDLYTALLGDSFITTSAVVVRRHAFDEVGGFDEGYLEVEDYDLWLRLAERHRFAPVYGQHVVYRRTPHSAMRAPGHQRRIRDQGLAIVRAACARRPVAADLQRRAESHILRSSAERLLAGGLVSAARADLRAALELTPADVRLWAMAVFSALSLPRRKQALRLRRALTGALAGPVALGRDGRKKSR
ncbi:MAG: glycosyltransferase [Deltaproteobacteria bacterium]|nr:glycosyltransferase [Deltaproteobacteria bacterium]